MARLTWQQVAAPNFSTAIDGVRTASSLLERAGTNISTGLANFDNAQQDIADQQIAQQVSQYQDPTQLKNALASGIIGAQVDPSRVSAQALNAAQGRVGTLLSTAINERTLADSNYDAARRLITDGRTDLLNQREDVKYERAEQNRLDGQEAAKHVRFIQENRTDPDLIREYMKAITSDTVRNLTMVALGDSYGKLYGADQAMGISALLPEGVVDGTIPAAIARANGQPVPYTDAERSAAGTQNGRPEDAVVGWAGSSAPVSQMPIRDVMKYGREVLIPSNRGKYGNPPDKGSSASGAFQITQETLQDFGRKVLGDDWESQPFSYENQEKIAKAIFEASKDGNLKKRWASLKNTAPGYYKDKSWEEVRTEILKGELGNDVYARMQQSGYFLPTASASPAASLTASARPVSESVPAANGGPMGPSITYQGDRSIPSEINRLVDTRLAEVERNRAVRNRLPDEDTGGLNRSGFVSQKGTPLQRNAFMINNILDNNPGLDPENKKSPAVNQLVKLRQEREQLLASVKPATPPAAAGAATPYPTAGQTQRQFVDNVGAGAPGSDFSQIPLGSSSDTYERALKLVELGGSTRKMQNDPFNIASAYRKNVGDGRSELQVANDVVAKGGLLEGLPADRVLPLIREVQRETGVNAATAASVIAQSIDRRSPFWDRVNWNTTNAGESYISKDSNLSAAVRQLKSGQFLEAVVANESMDQGVAEIKKNLEKMKLIEQARDKLRVQARTYPDARENLAKIEATLTAYEAALKQSVGRFSVNQNFQPQR